MQNAISEWLSYLVLTVSFRTRQNYEYHLRRLAKSAPDRKPSEWTMAQLVQHVADLRASGNGDAVLKQLVGALRNFFRYTLGDASPAQRVPYPKVHRRKQRTLDAETALLVLAACDTTSDKGARDLAIVSLMLDTGLRSSEVCRLKLANVDFAKRRLQVIVKGGDEQEAFFSKAVAENLARWLDIRKKHAAEDCETFFVSIWGNTPGRSLTRIGLQDICQKIAKRAGIPGLSPHDLRRTFATIAIRNGAPTRVVQAAGRWGSLQMVERYTADISAEDFERYSPVEALLKGKRE